MTTIKTLETRWRALDTAMYAQEAALGAGLITAAERRELDLRSQATRRALEIQAAKLCRPLLTTCMFCEKPATVLAGDWELCAGCHTAITEPEPGEAWPELELTT